MTEEKVSIDVDLDVVSGCINKILGNYIKIEERGTTDNFAEVDAINTTASTVIHRGAPKASEMSQSELFWSKVREYNWIATDEDGEIRAFTEEPKIVTDCMLGYWGDPKNGIIITIRSATGNPVGDWKDTLEEIEWTK